MMKINRVIISNYRNLQSVDVHINSTVALIGENNSGKSNFLKAITLPLMSEEYSYISKNLSWSDINDNAKKEYYNFIFQNREKIKSGDISQNELLTALPVVSVELHFIPKTIELFYVKDLSFQIKQDKILYGIRYEYKPNKINEIYDVVKNIVSSNDFCEESINSVKMNLLPIEYYSYSISVPNKGSVPYDVIKRFKYSSLEAERDDFSRTKERIGSKSLVKLLQEGLSSNDKLTIEKEYSHFFDELKKVSDIDKIINWQDDSSIEEAKEFFSHINILPNMPPMHSLLNSIRLGYDGLELSSQGLGNRNLILLCVLINASLENQNDTAFNMLTIEEPEAHLCINNIRLITSYLKILVNNSKTSQLFYSTHNTEFINKMGLKNVLIVHNGKVTSFLDELTNDEIDYLTRNPNLDIFKLFFSKKCILFEGISEELLIRSYIDSKNELNDIELLSFHKGFKDIIKIWKKVNKGTTNKLGIIRDYDNQPRAKAEHEKYDDGISICVRTTSEYTLEPEIVSTGNNYQILKKQYGSQFGWDNLSEKEMKEAWQDAKAAHMLAICKDISNGKLPDLQMPNHIQEVIEFVKK